MKMSYRSIPVQRSSLVSSPNNTLPTYRQASQQQHQPQIYQHLVQDDSHNYSHPSRVSHSADRQILSSTTVNGNYYSLNDRGQSDETWRSGNYGTLPLGSTTSSRSEASSHAKRPFESAFRSAIERMRLSSESRLEGLGQDTHYPGCSNTSVFPPGIIPNSTASAGSNYYRQNVRVSGIQEPVQHSSFCNKPPSQFHPVETQTENVMPPPIPVPRQRHKYGSQTTSQGAVTNRQTGRDSEINRNSSAFRRSSYDVPITSSATQTESYGRRELADEKTEKRNVRPSETTRDVSRSIFSSKYEFPSNVFPPDYHNSYERDHHPLETNEMSKEKFFETRKSAASTQSPFREVEPENLPPAKPKRQTNTMQSHNNTLETYTNLEEVLPSFSYPSPPPPVRRISHAKFSPRPQSVDERSIAQRPVSSHNFIDKVRSNVVSSSSRNNWKELKEFNPETEKEEKLELPSVKEIIQQVEAISRDPCDEKPSFEESPEVFPQRMTQSYYDDKSKPIHPPSSMLTKSAIFRDKQARVSDVLGRKGGDHQLSGDHQKLLDAFVEQKNEIEKLRREMAMKDTLISNLQSNLRRYEPWH